MTFTRWATRLLAALDLEPTHERVRFLNAWASCEGGTARNNPLNTTMHVPASTPYNSAGVQHFPDELAGLAATLLTLRLPYYATLRAALAAHPNDALAIARASKLALATWGTGSRCVIARLSA